MVYIGQDWNRASLFLLQTLQALEEGGELRFAKLLYVDADRERSKCIELNLACPPALIFYWDGKPLTLRRPDWDDDVKYVGCASRDRVRYSTWITLVNTVSNILYV